ncbi:MAG: InlB B-repeat-containing protein, partial [Chitinispirillaceae bacterium]|nr:InlB B-repeat-containing protein [Chitinispirillaceae bacterium]
MVISTHLNYASNFFLVVLSICFLCDLPDNPRDPKDAGISLIFKTVDGEVHEHSVVDTAGKTIAIGAVLFLPENFDSVKMTINDGDRVVDTIFNEFNVIPSTDTIWKEYVFTAPGVATAFITPFTALGLDPVNANITIIAQEGTPINHKPVIVITGDTILFSGETCRLMLTKTDPDAGQILTSAMTGQPAGATLTDSLFFWTTPADFVGTDTIQFFVIDDGNPPMSDTAEVVITIIARVGVNDPPKWSVDTLKYAMNDTAEYFLLLSGECSDADNDVLTYTLLEGSPAGDTINNASYTFNATSTAVGTHFVNIVAADSAGASDTLVIELTVEPIGVDNTPPTITFVEPVGDSAVVTAASLFIDALCSDASGIASVTATTSGGTPFTASLENGHYVMTLIGLNRETDTAVVIIAKDASLLGNIQSKTIAIFYPSTYTITYNDNGSAGGSVPADTTKYMTGDTVTVKGNSGNLSKTGATFAGWNTEKDGSGTSYAAGATFTMAAADVTLYARWTTNPTFTVTYLGNGNSGGTAPADDGNYKEGATVTVKGNTGSLSKTGATFAGWNTE